MRRPTNTPRVWIPTIPGSGEPPFPAALRSFENREAIFSRSFWKSPAPAARPSISAPSPRRGSW